jgi:hypothetical protein
VLTPPQFHKIVGTLFIDFDSADTRSKDGTTFDVYEPFRMRFCFPKGLEVTARPICRPSVCLL